jgi:hypothetical protein
MQHVLCSSWSGLLFDALRVHKRDHEILIAFMSSIVYQMMIYTLCNHTTMIAIVEWNGDNNERSSTQWCNVCELYRQ